MKGLFVNLIGFQKKSDLLCSGVYKKVMAQVETLRQYAEIEHKMVNSFGYVRARNIFDFVKIRLPFVGSMYNWKYDHSYDGYDFVYFRKAIVDRTVRKLLTRIKKNNPSTIVLFEIPTYPYDKEWAGVKKYPFLIKDRYNRKRLKKCVDRIVTMSNDKIIFGINTIHIMNGVDFASIPINPANNSDELRLISVASYGDRHGCDRLIEGIGRYYENGGKREIYFDIVGAGMPECYYQLVEKYGLEKRVLFHGLKYGEELDRLYANANFGVDVLALHRVNMTEISTLKSREYGARGLPFLSCSDIDYLPENYPFFYKVESNDNFIDISQLLAFFDAMREREREDDIPKIIRDYAESVCDIRQTMKPVIEYISDKAKMQ